MITVTSVEAQNRFGQLLDTVQREPVTITRHGRTAAFIVSSEAYQMLLGRLPESPNMAAYLDAITAFRGSGKQGVTADLLADRAAERARGE
ncbi:MAG: type II toxin-antitoxin system Phd/YefM family antitoxin [Rhodoferax sp.]|uniref:type II toxin-antitoxin system Phd/YefM family antitoxin n=1 Tax=Rhodoferax sp. TaxID=50421 RepID=UPI003263E519